MNGDMFYCATCTHPNTRPRISFSAEGICNGCQRAFEKVEKIDWKKKEDDLKALIANAMAKSPGREYDCVVPVSGGKDSTFQAWYATHVLKLNTLCVNITGFLPTKEGIHNLRNLSERLPVDLVSVVPNMQVCAKLLRIMMEKYGDPVSPMAYLMFSHIARICIQRKIPVMLLGENGEREYAGSSAPEFTDLDNVGVHTRIQSDKRGFLQPHEWTKWGFTPEEIAIYQEPGDDELRDANVQRLFLSDYVPWNNNNHLHVALNVVGGFTMREERSPGTYTFGYSIDDDLYDLYIWMTYPKFGFCRTVKYTSKDIQEGKICRAEGIRMVRDYDGEFPWRAFDRFCAKTRMSEGEFWSVVERFVGDEENLRREADAHGTPMKVPAWEKIAPRKWRMRKTLDGKETLLELPVPRPRANIKADADILFP